MTEHVSVEFSGDVAEVVIDTPNDKNALDGESAEAFAVAVEQVDRSAADVAVVRGAGDTFSAGGDLTLSAEAFVDSMDTCIDGIVRMFTSDVPFVAAIRGAAIGGGFEIAMACDFRVAGEDATLALPEVTLGMLPPAGAVRFLAHVAGRATALELCLTGRRLTGVEAAERGLVTEAVSDEDVYATARSLATDLSNNSSAAIAAVKQSVNEAFPRPISEAKWDLTLARSLAQSDDFVEGKRAFLEGRPPEF